MNFPKLYRIRQHFDRTVVRDIPKTVKAELRKLTLREVKAGSRVAITAGSRGIDEIVLILQAIVEFLKELGAEPFLFPAMGSHGGATAQGQIDLLAQYGVTEAALGTPILSSMEVVEIGKTEDGVPIFIDKNAYEADHIVVVNRVKPHTKFKASVESGLMKMMAIGMGKQKGADYYHKAAIQYTFPRIIVDAGLAVLEKAPVLCGVAVVENAYHQIAEIVAARPEKMLQTEKDLLVLAKKMMPKLPFNDIDLLIVDEMGKDISGTGMDPNVTGRNRDLLGVFDHPTHVKRLFVRDLTEKSKGNAIGIGFADLATKRLVDKIDPQATYRNCITGISLEKGAVPMHFETDREAIEVGLGSIGLTPPEMSRVVRIKNTVKLEIAEVSEVYREELLNRPDLEILEGPRSMAFDHGGNLVALDA